MQRAAVSGQVCHNGFRNGVSGSRGSQAIQEVLGAMADVFGEISASQEILADSLLQTFVRPMEEFCASELTRLTQGQIQYRKDKALGDDSTIRYLQSDNPGFGFARARDNSSQYAIDLKAYELANCRKKFELTRFDLIGEAKVFELKKSFEVSEACTASMIALRTYFNYCSEKLHSCHKFIQTLNHQLHHDRIKFDEFRADLGEKRAELVTALQVSVDRVSACLPAHILNERDQQAQLTSDRLDQVVAFSGAMSLHPDDVERVTSVASSALSKISAIGANFFSGFGTKPTERSVTGSSASANSGGVRGSTTGGNAKSLQVSPVRITGATSSDTSSSDVVTAETMSGSRMALPKPLFIDSLGADPSYVYALPETPSSVDMITLAAPTLTEVESRVQALSKVEIDGLYVRNQMEELAGVIKQGYVWEKSQGKIIQSPWSREWLVLDSTKLYFIKGPDRNDNSTEVQVICDLMLASVRDNAKLAAANDTVSPYMFEIAHANIKTYTFLAEGPREYAEWVDGVRNCIEKRLTLGFSASPYLQVANSSSSAGPTVHALEGGVSDGKGNSTIQTTLTQSNVPSSAADMISRRQLMASEIESLLQSNTICAECGKLGADWVSLNLGAFICIDCSGVHRSLGVHISKVRSLTLDDLEPEEYQFLKATGNSINHRIWQHQLIEGYTSPIPTDSHAARDRFIRAKYEHKLFLLPTVVAEPSSEWLSDRLLEACLACDIFSVMLFIAHGANINATSPTIDTIYFQLAKEVTSLHAAAYSGSIECVVALLTNGAEAHSLPYTSPVIGIESAKMKDESAVSDEAASTRESDIATDGVEEQLLPSQIASRAGHSKLSAYIHTKAETKILQPSASVRDPSPSRAILMVESVPVEENGGTSVSIDESPATIRPSKAKEPESITVEVDFTSMF